MNKNILIVGSTGFLGSRIKRRFEIDGTQFEEISRSSGLDLTDESDTRNFFNSKSYDCIMNCSAFVGGIEYGNLYPIDLLEKNLLMSMNLYKYAAKSKVKRIINPISNCAYPGDSTYFKENEFWNGELHESVLSYGLARKVSTVLSKAYMSQTKMEVINLVFSNMYGPGDHFEETRSHALGALIMKFSRAVVSGDRYVTVWGSGSPVREWLYVDDAVNAMILGMRLPPEREIINVGTGEGISISNLAKKISDEYKYYGKIIYDLSKPDGAKYKTVDGSQGFKLMGWKPSTTIEQGIKNTIKWYEENKKCMK